MNVDVLVNKAPSIRWYFAAVVSFSALVLAVAFVSTRINKRRRAQDQNRTQRLPEKEGKRKLFGL